MIAEEALLGALLYDPQALDGVRTVIRAEDFSDPARKLVYKAMLECVDTTGTFDFVLLAEQLKGGPNGVQYLTGLTDKCPSPYNWKAYALQVREDSLRRSIARLADEIKMDVLRYPVDQVLDSALTRYDSLRSSGSLNGTNGFDMLADQVQADFEAALINPAEIRGFTFGLPNLDAALGGLAPGTVTMIMGNTNMGKSSLAVSGVGHMMMHKPGLVGSTESQPKAWLTKLVAFLTQITFDRIVSGFVTKEQAEEVRDAIAVIRARNCHIVNDGSPSPETIGALYREGVRKYGYEWLCMDSASKMSVPGVSDVYTRYAIIADGLQNLARDTNAAVLITSQVKPEVTRRDNKLPTSEDVMGGAPLANNADAIIAILYNQYYVDRGMAKPHPILSEGIVLAQVIKHRWRASNRNTGALLTFKGGAGFYDRPGQSGSVEGIFLGS